MGRADVGSELSASSATGSARFAPHDQSADFAHTIYITLCKHPLHQEQQAEARQAQDADEKGVEPV